MKRVTLMITIMGTMIIALMLPRVCLAGFSLSVTPYQGGYDLVYEKVGVVTGRVNNEVTVRVSSDTSTRYQLTMNILDPLTNARGETLPEGSFVVYGIRGSNRYGTLNVEEERPLSWGRQIVYTSDTSGASDSFILVFGMIPDERFEAGSYRGRIAFSIEPIDSSAAPVNAVLNVIAEVESSEPVITITTEGFGKEIYLDPTEESKRVVSVLFNIGANMTGPFKILQVVTQAPVSMEGNFLDWPLVQFKGRDAGKGTVISDTTGLSSVQQVIYQSSGDAGADSFVIDYFIDETISSLAQAGSYRTTIQYLLEPLDSGVKVIDAFTLSIENPRFFDLVVTPANGGIIRFSGIKPSMGPQVSEVIVETRTNIGRRYQVSQRMLSRLVNRSGSIIPEKYFTLKEESIDTKGDLRFTASVPVREGDMVLFVSDSAGSADTFRIIYELNPSTEIKAGDYSARIMYTISEI